MDAPRDNGPLLDELRKALKLENNTLRKGVLVLLPLFALALLIAGWLISAIEVTASVGFATTATVYLLAIIIDDLKEQKHRQASLEVFQNDDITIPAQQGFVTNNLLAEVKLYEYSATSIMESVISKLAGANVQSIKILLHDPTQAWGDGQQMRILSALRRIRQYFNLETANARGLRIHIYTVPGSLRGRLYKGSGRSQLLVMNTYTYHRHRSRSTGTTEITGFENPVVMTSGKTDESLILINHFENVFDTIWEDRSSSLPLTDKWPEISALGKEMGQDDLGLETDWIEAVSSE